MYRHTMEESCMKIKEQYIGIDYFRLVAALLVVAIHTSPLTTMDGTADFILTRIIGRVAVPFFFMATGFFLLPSYMAEKNIAPLKLFDYIKKALLLYGIAMLLYLPVNLYVGYFKMEFFIPNLIKDILFDGTFYHLWYLPAAIIGITMTYFLLKRMKISQALWLTLILYLIGLFGDSYYGSIETIPPLKVLYHTLFFFFDYTRNGLFFAPIFFLMGGMIWEQRGRYKPKTCILGLNISLVLMISEGQALHYIGIQRHDSMYFMLLPCMFFLFHTLLLCKGKSIQNLRVISMIVYLIHPLFIIMIRGFAKVVHLQNIFIENSVCHYVAVAGCSCIAAILITMVLQIKREKNNVPPRMDRAWMELSFHNLRHNVEALQTVIPKDCQLMAVIKADAYGHGHERVGLFLNEIGVMAFGVATIDEGIALRKHKLKGDILVLGYTVPERALEIIQYDLMQTVTGYEHAKQLNDFGQTIQVHVKIDTGMHRLGENCENTIEIDQIFRLENLKICGAFTHLSLADSRKEEDVAFSQRQIQKFYALLGQLELLGNQFPKIHIQSSYGLLNYPELQCDYVRVGIALYGSLSMPHEETRIQIDLWPVLSLKARVALTRTIVTGESVSYGRHFLAHRDTCIAVLPIGYADGLPRSLSCEKGYVLIHGSRAPIIGRICMDQLMIDVTDIEAVKPGDIATLIGRDGEEEMTAAQMAENAETIANELLSRLGSRLERVYVT